MIGLQAQIAVALVLDALLGDPRWLPHPVKLLGWLARFLEAPTRFLMAPRAAGAVTALLVVAVSAGTTLGLIRIAGAIHPRMADVAEILVLYLCFAAGDLALHARRVLVRLRAGLLPEARARVGLMVGRDTDSLDEAGVVRAAVESVAENTVDGVTAPLFYACLLGPVGAMAYKALSTLDSTFGYKSERYLEFGWASARLDDLANWIPARLTGWIIPLAAGLNRKRFGDALRVMRRDGSLHCSPNAGIAEAAMAGALGIQLGGSAVYQGIEQQKPLLGDAGAPLSPAHIQEAVELMWTTALLAAGVFVSLGWMARNAAAGMGGS